MSQVSLSDVRGALTLSPSGVMDYHEAVIRQISPTMVVVGYICDDEFHGNPLEEMDGEGLIHCRGRYGNRESESNMQEALAMDSSWEPCVNTTEVHEAVAARMMPRIRKALSTRHESVKGAAAELRKAIREGMREHYNYSVGEDPLKHALELIEKGLKEGNDNDWPLAQTVAGQWSRISSVLQTALSDLLIEACGTNDLCDEMKSAWEDLRDEGKIGNPHAVMLDLYDHSGLCYSIAGTGMNCRWDTSGGAAVWVPDDSAREEILRRAKAYAYGRVEDNGSWTKGSGKKRYFAVLDTKKPIRSPDFLEWHMAFEWLEQNHKRKGIKPNQQRGEYRAAVELAASAVELFNYYVNGHCYGAVVATLENQSGDVEDPVWEEIDYDVTGMESGDSDIAIEYATAMANGAVASLTTNSTADGSLPISA